MHPNVIVPTLDGGVGPGIHWLACVVGASDDPSAVDAEHAPTLPPGLVERLEAFAARVER
jgi:hypothetical protein